MEPEALLDTLTREGILEETSATDVRVSENIRTRIDRRREELERLRETDERVQFGGREFEIGEQNMGFLARAKVLEEATSLTSQDVLADVSLILSWFLRSMPRQEGSPDQFLPIHGDQLPVVIQVYSPAVVYVWLDDCEPCDLIKSDFERQISKGLPEDLGLFSVFGPDHAEYLEDAYNIVGGPMLLFIANSRIDTRLHGAHEPELVEREIETIRERDDKVPT